MLIKYDLYSALVVDDNDTLKLGRVKVKLIPEMNDLTEDMLPWASPMNYGLGMGDTTARHNPPVKDSRIFVACLDKYYKEFRYVADEFLEDNAKYTDFENIKNNISDTQFSVYPNPRFKYINGNIIFYDTENNAMGIYHTGGSYAIMNQDGEIYVYSKSKLLKCYNDKTELSMDGVTGDVTLKNTTNDELTYDGTLGDITLKNLSNTLEMTSTGFKTSNITGAEIGVDTALMLFKNAAFSLKTVLDNLITAITSITTFGSPVSHVLTPASIASLNAIKVQLVALFKE